MVKRCSDCEREKVEREVSRLMESWLCFFYVEEFCPYPKVPKDKRLGSVCLDCAIYLQFNREMHKEEAEFWEFEEAVRKNPDAYLRGEI